MGARGVGVLAVSLAAASGLGWSEAWAVALTPQEELGKALFFDRNLSKNRNQSCASCHDPAVGFTGPDSAINAHGAVYAGSDPALFGNRKPPAAAYAGDSPALARDPATGEWKGGMFWDGRADGSSALADPLAEQAKGPFLNPLEQALSSAEELRDRVRSSTYAGLFERVWGAGALDLSAAAVYDRIAVSVAAYERSAEVSAYTSKFDLFWDKARAKRVDPAAIATANWTRFRRLGLNDTELYGLAIFNDASRANCASCHSLEPGPAGRPLFTGYGYANLGMPRNPENPFYANLAYNPAGASWVDEGLGGFLSDSEQRGRMKVPTLRNVDKRPYSTFVKAFGHNGALKSLDAVVAFYHWRAMEGCGCGGGGMGGRGMGGGGGMGMMFGPPEVDANLAPLSGFPGMDRSYLVAFLKTLSDGYFTR